MMAGKKPGILLLDDARSVTARAMGVAPTSPVCVAVQACAIIAIFLLLCSAAFAQPSDIVYTAAPWHAGERNLFADGEQIAVQNGDCDLWKINLFTGDRTKLVDAPPTDAIVDPDTYDGRYIVFAWIYDSIGGVNRGPRLMGTGQGTDYTERLAGQFGTRGADLFRYDVQTGELIQLTHAASESTPIPGGTEELPVFNTGPCIIEALEPDGSKSRKIIFTSNRNQLHSAVDSMVREPIMQLFVMDWDGGNVELVGHMNLGGALHPFRLHDGRIAFFTHESQANRHGKPWAMWIMNPDGTHWVPSWPAFEKKDGENSIIHWGSQAPNLRLQVVEYYPNKVGAGNLYDYPFNNQSGSDVASENTKIKDSHGIRQFPFQPERALFTDQPTRSLTPFASHADDPGEHIVHPRGAPGGLLVTRVVSSQFGGNKSFNQPAEVDIYFIKDAEPAATADDLIKIIDDPDVMEMQAIALCTPKEIYGADIPAKLWLPNPTGTPYAWVGTSTVYQPHRQSKNVNPDAVRDGKTSQGTDTDVYDEAEIAGLRYVHQIPTPRFGKSDDGMWTVAGDERMAVIGEVAPEADGSNLVKLYADLSWGMQLVDKYGRALTQAGTWKQLRPGETRTDCNGCHAHTPERAGPDFASSIAGQPGFKAKDLTTEKPRLVEWFRDVKPILEAHGFAAPDDLRSDSSQIVIWSARRSPLLTHIIDGEPLEGETPLTLEEIRTIAIWIDLGCAVEGSAGKFFADTQRPALTLGQKEAADGVALVGAVDPEGPVKVDVTVDGQAADFVAIDGNRWQITVDHDATVIATATDAAGNTTTLSRRITAGPVTPPPLPAEIQVLYETADVLIGESTISFGSTPRGVPVTKIFTVTNLGEESLTLESPTVPEGFVVNEALAATLGPNESDSFEVMLDRFAPGEYSGVLSIATNDTDENPFTFVVSGTVTEPSPPDEVTILRAQVAELQAQVAKLTDKIMRVLGVLQEN